MRAILMVMILAFCSHAYSLSIGETQILPDETIKVSTGKNIQIEPTIRIVGEERSYEAWYDLKEQEVSRESAFEEIQEIFNLKKPEIISRELSSALITAFTTNKEPGYSCLFKAKTGWKPKCLKQK